MPHRLLVCLVRFLIHFSHRVPAVFLQVKGDSGKKGRGLNSSSTFKIWEGATFKRILEAVELGFNYPRSPHWAAIKKKFNDEVGAEFLKSVVEAMYQGESYDKASPEEKALVKKISEQLVHWLVQNIAKTGEHFFCFFFLRLLK